MNAAPLPPGKLIDVGGYRLHLQSQGTGFPAAVMDSGLAGNSIWWTNTLSAVAKHTQACAFAELRALLTHAGVQPPYILIGHSFGAINMLVYAYQYPHEVAGLVLVDPSHPEMFDRMPKVPPPEMVRRIFKLLDGLGRLGLLRLLGPALARQLLPDGQRTLPDEAWQAFVFFVKRAKDFRTAAREADAGWENFAQARGEAGSLGDLQLEVLTAEWWTTGKPMPMKEGGLVLHKEMAKLSSQGRHLIVSSCDHSNLPLVRQDAVAESVKHILDVGRRDCNG